MDQHIREATLDDLAAMREILNAEIRGGTANWADVEKSPVDMAVWCEARLSEGRPVLVADYAGEVVGYASYGAFRAGPGYRFTVEHSVYVRPDRQGLGLGRALLEALIERARAQGMHAMVGGIGAENGGSIAMHAKLGFAEVGRLPQVGRKFDRWLDLVFMHRLL